MRYECGPFLLAIVLPLSLDRQHAPSSVVQGGPVAAGVAVEASRPDVPLQRLVDSLGVHRDSIWLLVLKSQRTFSVMVGEEPLRTWPCVLGENPVGDKMMQGDRRTPEGEFTFRDKYPHRQWHKFVWVDYPNAESWRRFRERKRTGAIPGNADIGGEIGIHGVPAGMDHWITQGADWTWGCIALRNADLDELYPFIEARRTIIRIRP